MHLPPGPKSPAVWQLVRYAHAPLPFLESCARQFGDTFLTRLAGFGKLVMLSNPDAVAEVFRGSPETLHSGEGNSFLSLTVGASSVLVLDEGAHARHPIVPAQIHRIDGCCRDGVLRQHLDEAPGGNIIRHVPDRFEHNAHPLERHRMGRFPIVAEGMAGDADGTAAALFVEAPFGERCGAGHDAAVTGQVCEPERLAVAAQPSARRA